MSERLQNMGKRAEDRIKLKSLDMRITVIREAIRTELYSFKPTDDLNADLIIELAMELAGKLIDYKSIKEELAKLDEILGR